MILRLLTFSIISLFFLSFSTSSNALDQKQMIRDITKGKCETMECWQKLLHKDITKGKCETSECSSKYFIKKVSKKGCESSKCLREELNLKLGLPKDYQGSYGGNSYDYNVSGNKISSGKISKWSSTSKYVDGEITLKNGKTIKGDGRFIGNGIVEFQANGQTYELEVD